MAEKETTGTETPLARIDINLRLELWNEVYDLLGPLSGDPDGGGAQTDEQHDARVDATEEMVSLVRRYAPVIMAAAQGQAKAERLIGEALSRLSQPELDRLMVPKERS